MAQGCLGVDFEAFVETCVVVCAPNHPEKHECGEDPVSYGLGWDSLEGIPDTNGWVDGGERKAGEAGCDTESRQEN